MWGVYSVLHAQTPSLPTPKISHHIKFIQVDRFANKLEVILIALESRGCATNLVRGGWESLRVKSPCVYCSLRDTRLHKVGYVKVCKHIMICCPSSTLSIVLHYLWPCRVHKSLLSYVNIFFHLKVITTKFICNILDFNQ